jgi:ankyrin repeat protein
MRILTQMPELPRANLYTAVVCGELAEVDRLLGENPRAAVDRRQAAGAARDGTGEIGDSLRRPLGPKLWEPLLFLCFTRLPLPAANDNALAIARTLLDRGADPNAFFMAGDSRYTPLVGVIGEGEEDRPPHPHRDALARLLLERGAQPYDIQVVYNIGFRADVLWFLELIHEFSVRAGRQADWDDPEWSMLGMGGYGSGARWHLGMAVRENDIELAEWCLAHGANPETPPAKDPRLPDKRLVEVAVRSGHLEMADLLERYGAKPVPRPMDPRQQFSNACFRVDVEAARRLASEHPELLRQTDVIFKAVKSDRADVVRLLLDLGMSPDIEDDTKQRPLHMAGYDDAVQVGELLIARGAEIDPVESSWNNTPIDAAVYSQSPRMIALLGRHSRNIWNLVYTGAVERVRELLAADPSLARRVSAEGWTPLMWLPDDEERAVAIIELFVRHGADVTLRNTEGQSAADYARKRAMNRAAALLSR